MSAKFAGHPSAPIGSIVGRTPRNQFSEGFYPLKRISPSDEGAESLELHIRVEGSNSRISLLRQANLLP
jgi:hypothetical protein